MKPLSLILSLAAGVLSAAPFPDIPSRIGTHQYAAVCAVEGGGEFTSRFLIEAVRTSFGSNVVCIPAGAWGERDYIARERIDVPAVIVYARDGREVLRMRATNVQAVGAGIAKFCTPRAPIPDVDAAAVDRIIMRRIAGDERALAELMNSADTVASQCPSFAAASWLKKAALAETELAKPTRRFLLKRRVRQQIVIVPDTASFYEELSRWNDETIYPILIGNSHLSVLFAEAFGARLVMQTAPSGSGADADAVLRSCMNAVSKQKVHSADVRAVNERMITLSGNKPIGIVIIDPDSPCAPAGAALAAARGEPIYLRPSFGAFTNILTRTGAEAIRADIERFAASLAVPYRAFGDCDGITLAADAPFRYRADDGDPERGERVLDDLIDEADGFPWGVTGRLIGDAPSSVYRAMCSIFLSPKEALFFSRYSSTSEPWRTYSPTRAPDTMRTVMRTRTVRAEDATLNRWHEEMAGGNTANVLFINSSGGSHEWSVFKGTATSEDIPATLPAMIHIIHSGSASRPLDPTSILGRWLSNGAYAYYGSMAEPMLEAFTPPDRIAALTKRGYPLALASRAIIGRYSYPWRLFFTGDPLTLVSQDIARVAELDTKGRTPRTDAEALLFGALYRGAWNEALITATNMRDALVYNAALYAYAKTGGTHLVAALATNRAAPALWPMNMLAAAVVYRRAAATGSIEGALNAYRFSHDARIMGILARTCADDRLRWGDFEALVISNASRSQPVLSLFTAYFSGAVRPDAEEFLLRFAPYTKGVKDIAPIIAAYACRSTNISAFALRATDILSAKGDKENASAMIASLMPYLLLCKDHQGMDAAAARLAARSASSDTVRYYTLLAAARHTRDPALLGSEISNGAAYLLDEARILRGEPPARSAVALPLIPGANFRIDGVIEYAWTNAGMIRFGEPASEIRIAADHERVYVAGTLARSGKAPFIAKAAARDGAAWEDESVELFFDAARDYRSVHQIIITVKGVLFDYLSYDRTWNGDIRSAVKETASGWTFEMAIPRNDLFPAGLTAGDVFGFNAVRNTPPAEGKRRWVDCGAANHNAREYGYCIVR